MKRKKDYQKKDYRNPYFSQKQKSKTPKRFKFYGFILIILIIVGLYFLNSADQLQIKNVEISGNEYIGSQGIKSVVSEQLAKKRWLFFSQSNIVFFNKSSVKKELLGAYLLDELKIKKKYPDTLDIQVKEKISALVWATGEEKYFLDLNGVVIRKITADDLIIQPGEGESDIVRPEFSSGQYPIIYDQDNEPVTIGQPALTDELVDFIIALSEELKETADFDIAHYKTTQHPLEIILITKEGWEARFKTDSSAKDQAELLSQILIEKVKNRSELEYIDLRFEGKVFYQ